MVRTQEFRDSNNNGIDDRDEGGSQSGSIDKGMFNFQGVMDTFYAYQPGADDSEGRGIKNSFMANMVQSGFDAQLAKGMAQQQSQIAQSNMTLAADLEQRNTASNMKQEFNYGMQSMGAQYEFQNQFAENQSKRDQAMVGVVGQDTRKTVAAQGTQDRLTTVTQGEQTRLNTQTAGSEQRKGIAAQGSQDRLNIGATGEESRKNIAASGTEDRLSIGKQGEEQRLTVGEQGKQERETIGVQGKEQRATDTNKLVTGGEQQRLTDSNVAQEGRKTIGYTDTVEAGKENRQAARSRTMARSF